MKFAQEEWQCVGGGSCEAKVFSLEEKYSPVRPWRTETLVRFSSKHRLSILASSQASIALCSCVPFCPR